MYIILQLNIDKSEEVRIVRRNLRKGLDFWNAFFRSHTIQAIKVMIKFKEHTCDQILIDFQPLP